MNEEIKKTKKLPLPAKIEDLIKLVMKSEYSKKTFKNNKLSIEKNTAFKNNAIVYQIKILDKNDPLNQMMKLNARRSFSTKD